MLSYVEAKRIGLNACIDKLGRSFVQKYANSSTSAHAKVDDMVYCYVGVENNPNSLWSDPGVRLTSRKAEFPYSASCNVHMSTGRIEFLECKTPNQR